MISASLRTYRYLRVGLGALIIVIFTAVAVAINSWNRFAIAFRAAPQVKGARAAA